MSMNVNITASREVSFKKKDGKIGYDIQTVRFKVVQTPTKISYEILASDDPIQAYIDYVITCRNPEKEPIFAEDDVFCERDPIGYRDYDWTEEHISDFREWLDKVEEDGYEVTVEVW